VILDRAVVFIVRVDKWGQYGRDCRDIEKVRTRNLSELICKRGKYWYWRVEKGDPDKRPCSLSNFLLIFVS
jgi:hypothetical protein